jgi:hypothetical protein
MKKRRPELVDGFILKCIAREREVLTGRHLSRAQANTARAMKESDRDIANFARLGVTLGNAR